MILALDDPHVIMPTAYVTDTIDLLNLLNEVLRYGGEELRVDIDERYPRPRMTKHLITTIDGHTSMLRFAIKHKGLS